MSWVATISEENVTVVTIGSQGPAGPAASIATDAIWDAAGDMVVGTGANTAARVPIGTSGYVWTSNGTTAAWTASAAGSGTVISIPDGSTNGVTWTVATRTTTPTFTFTLGAITPTTVNGNTITTGTGTLTLGAGKTLTASNTITFTATDGSTLAIGTGGTLGTMAYETATNYATQAELAAAVAGIKWKSPVRVATTVNGTLATAFENGDTVDGVVLATGDRILLKNQSTGAENGIYTINASGAPTRATDADTGAELVAAAVFAMAGTANADRAFLCTNDAITIGVTSIVFTGFASSLGALLAANNLSDLTNLVTARQNLVLGATDNVTFADITVSTIFAADGNFSQGLEAGGSAFLVDASGNITAPSLVASTVTGNLVGNADSATYANTAGTAGYASSAGNAGTAAYATTAGSATISGTVTTNANLTGPVTSVGNATTITPAAVTLAMMANLAQDQFIVRTTASTGVPQTATVTATARTAMALVVGNAGAIVTFNGALGSPSSVGTMPAHTLGGTISGGGNQINNVIIGTTTPLAGTFTTLVAGSATSILVGTAGSVVGSVGFRNATSGSITLAPTTGALGTVTITLPALTGTLYVSGGALGTPASGTLTNCTIPASALTGATLASNVLTASLTRLGDEVGIGRAAAGGYSLATQQQVFFGGKVAAVIAGEGVIAGYGANGVADLLSISYVSNETLFTGSPYGNTVIATASNQNIVLRPHGTGRVETTASLALTTVGTGILIKEGSNACMGVATLVGGTVTVSTTKVTANSRIFLTSQADGGTPGFLRITARTGGTSFVITSSIVADTSVVGWLIMEPA